MTQNADTVANDPINLVKPTSEFRSWVHNLWIDNCEERSLFGETKLDKLEYWHRFKWWVKREYQRKKKIEKEKHEKRNRSY